MRVLSPHPGYSVQVFQGKENREVDGNGSPYTRVEVEPLVAHFEAGHGLFPHETELALRVFGSVIAGLPEGTNPATRIAVFDTEAIAEFRGWDAEYHQKVQDRLRVLAQNAPSRLVVAEDIKAPRPWPKYDEQDADEVIAAVEFIGVSPEDVIRYENERDEPRVVILTAMQALLENAETAAVVSG